MSRKRCLNNSKTTTFLKYSSHFCFASSFFLSRASKWMEFCAKCHIKQKWILQYFSLHWIFVRHIMLKHNIYTRDGDAEMKVKRKSFMLIEKMFLLVSMALDPDLCVVTSGVYELKILLFCLGKAFQSRKPSQNKQHQRQKKPLSKALLNVKIEDVKIHK